jgi:hypothetical protein
MGNSNKFAETATDEVICDQTATVRVSDMTVLEIISYIALEWENRHDPDGEFNAEMRSVATRVRKSHSAKVKMLEAEKKRYIETVDKYFQNVPMGKLPSGGYGILGPKLNDVTHPLRVAQERYLINKMNLQDSGNSTNNWVMIGISQADKSDSPFALRYKNTTNTAKGGRPKSGVGLDYERAVWKLYLDEFMFEFFGDDVFEFIGVLGLSKILDAFDYAFEHSNEHPHIETFEKIESELKMKFKSREGLYVSFNRGEKERAAMWGA